MKKYNEYKGLNLPQVDKEVLGFWHANRVFEQSIENRKNAKPFVFYEGPPSANGLPGIHHVMSRTIKDLFCRYKSLKGFKVERKGGWDTHGLPVELGVEKKMGITKEDIGVKISIAEYNERCKASVLEFKEDWDKLTRDMGYWVDLDNPYITFDKNYIESIWWILKQLYNKGYLYKGYTIQPFSPAAGTGLSSHELNLPGCYRNVKDTSVTAMFRINAEQDNQIVDNIIVYNLLKGYFQEPALRGYEREIYFLAWTTTPWTLPSNTALAVGEKIKYLIVNTINPYTYKVVTVIIAKDLFDKYFDRVGFSTNHPEVGQERSILLGSKVEERKFQIDAGVVVGLTLGDLYEKGKVKEFRIIGEVEGKDLAGIQYEQLMPYVQLIDGDKFKVIIGDFVSTEDGTGIVHIAPSFGADDMRVAKQNGIGSLTLVDKRGRFVDAVTDFAGLPVKNYDDLPEKEWDNKENTDIKIAIKLKTENKAFKVEKYEHNYPHCWRTDKPVIYYPLDSWFIRTTAVKDRMVELNNTINWKPASTGTGRFGNWLENLVDWNLSRSRYWGTPLPIWRNILAEPDSDARDIVIGAFEEMLTIGEQKKDGENKFSGCKAYILDEKFDVLYSRILKNDEDIFNKIEQYNQQHSKFFTKGDIDIETLRRGQFDKDDLLRKLPMDFLEEFVPPITKENLDSLDPHKPYVDNIVFLMPNNSPMLNIPIWGNHLFKREADLIDVWFDSGAMPYAQWHYPFENKEQFEANFPADFIAEGMDQTRGWFFTLHAIGVLLMDSIAYKNVVSNGLLLDKNGNKMSKRLGNTVNPFETLSTYGADATRWYIISNSQPWDNLKFDVAGIQEVQRKFFGTLYNTYAFFSLYANIDGFTYAEAEVPLNERPEIDRWIISLLNTLIKDVDSYYDDYEPTKAARAIQDFVDEHLSNWYVRLCRRRFWKGEYNADKIAAYQTLYRCLEVLAQLASPIAPFFTDRLYRDLNNVTSRQIGLSVHLTDFPVADESVIDKGLEERMDMAQVASSLILSLRKKHNIKVRQPLNKVLVPVVGANFREQFEKVEHLVLSEVNVKQIEYLADTSGVITKKIKPNFPKLGSKLGPKLKLVGSALAAFDQNDIRTLETNGQYELSLDGEPFVLMLDEVDITSEDIPGWLVASEGRITVALDITITPELLDEGNARELVNRIQNLRKEMELNVTDRINVQVQKQEEINSAIINFNDYIRTEVLAENLLLVDLVNNGNILDVNGISLHIAINKN